MDKLKFNAELQSVSSKKLKSLDMEYKVTLLTNDSRVLSLGMLDADTMLMVEVKV